MTDEAAGAPLLRDDGLRAARDEDAEAIAAILRGSIPDPWSAVMIAEGLRHGVRGIVAEEDGAVVGVALLQVVVPEAELLQVAVATSRRRRGLGRRLLRAAAAAAAGEGCTEIFLEVRPSNDAARALYAAEGFAEAGLRRAYYRNGEDALVLRRPLAHRLPPPSEPVR